MPSAGERGARWTILPVVLSLVLGLWYWLSVPVTVPSNDAELYHRIGGAISGRPDPFFAIPGRTLTGLYVRGITYPALLALVYWVTRGPHVGAVTFLQGVVILPLLVLLTYLTGRRVFDHRTGILAAWITALWLPFVWHTAWIMTEIWQTLLVSLFLCFYALSITKGGKTFAGLSGIFLGIVSLSHSAYQYLPWAVVATLILHYRRHLWERAREHMVFGAGLFIILLPFHAVRIYENLPSLGQGGLGFGGGGAWAFYIGSRPETKWYVIPDDFKYTDATTLQSFKRVVGQIESGEIWMEPTLRQIIMERQTSIDPAARRLKQSDFYRAGLRNWLEAWYLLPNMVWTKACQYFSIRVGFGPAPRPAISPLSPMFMILNWIYVDRLLLLLASAGLALVIGVRTNRLLIFVPLLFQTALFLASQPVWRYSYPLTPSMILLAAYPICLLWARHGQRARREFGRLVGRSVLIHDQTHVDRPIEPQQMPVETARTWTGRFAPDRLGWIAVVSVAVAAAVFMLTLPPTGTILIDFDMYDGYALSALDALHPGFLNRDYYFGSGRFFSVFPKVFDFLFRHLTVAEGDVMRAEKRLWMICILVYIPAMFYLT
ncbi:MAG: glycosyltransferase family 39 protein [Acidobacteria bacterium]|nr:glycosyltransferase family 39 protein [Acidobacteriota bacterium]